MSFGRRAVPPGWCSSQLSPRKCQCEYTTSGYLLRLHSGAPHDPVRESDSRLAYCFRRPLVAEIGIQSPPAGAGLAATGNGHEPEFRREDWASW
jgi:hypothetical protein